MRIGRGLVKIVDIAYRQTLNGRHRGQIAQFDVFDHIVNHAAFGVDEHAKLPDTVARTRIGYVDRPVGVQRRIERPGVQVIYSLPADQVIVARAREQPIIVAGVTESTVAPEPVVAAKTVQPVAADPAVHPIAPAATQQNINSLPAVEHAYPVIASIVQGRQVHRIGSALEAYHVVAVQAGYAELLDQRNTFIVKPVGQHRVRRDLPRSVRLLHRRGDLNLQAIVAVVAHQNRVALGRTLDQQDVGSVVVGPVALAAITEVPVERLAVFGVVGVGVEFDYVDPATAADRVVVVLAFQPIRISTAPHLVLSAAAIEVILAGVAPHPVVAAVPGRVRVVGVIRPAERITVEVVVSAVAEEEVIANIAVKLVIARPAVHLVTAKSALASNVYARGEGIQVVHAAAAPHPLADLAGEFRGAAPGVAVDHIATVVAIYLIDSDVTVEDIVVRSAANDIIARTAANVVAADSAVNIVVSAITVDNVGHSAAEHEVRTAAGPYVVLAIIELPIDRKPGDYHRGYHRRSIDVARVVYRLGRKVTQR